jgi:hypothetical protein
MFYAIAHIPQGANPAPIIRLAAPSGTSLPALQAALAGSIPTGATPSQGATPAKPAVVKGSVFEMPPGLPAFLTKQIVVPKTDEDSEFAALASVARQTGVPFSHTGPDYALVGTKVPFGRPVPSYEFLWYVGKSYIPGTVDIDGSGAIKAVNQSLAGGSLAGGGNQKPAGAG